MIIRILSITGLILITIGVIGGFIAYDGIDKENYKEAKEIYNEIPINEIAEASYKAAKQLYISEITYVLVIALGGIVSGLLLIGLARVIEVLEEKKEQVIETNKYLYKIHNLQSEKKPQNV